MAYHPINLAFRFVLELATYFALGYWGWVNHPGGLRLTWTFGLPLLAAVLWGIFAVPSDKSRSGNAPVPVPGVLRLVLELVFFAAGALALSVTAGTGWGLGLGLLSLIHYIVSYERVIWLLSR